MYVRICMHIFRLLAYVDAGKSAAVMRKNAPIPICVVLLFVTRYRYTMCMCVFHLFFSHRTIAYHMHKFVHISIRQPSYTFPYGEGT